METSNLGSCLSLSFSPLQIQQIYPTAEAPVRIDDPSQIGGPDTQILNFQKKIPRNSNLRVLLKGDVLFLKKKKAPARNAPVVVRAGFHQKSKIQGILTKEIPFSEKVREAK